MATATIDPFSVGQYVLVDVADYGPDGVTLDTEEALQVTNNNGLVTTAIVNPGNPRQVKITGVGAGSSSVVVSAPGVAPGNGLTLTITVNSQVNNSKITLVGVQGPFAVT